jgi:hypothetical protein
MRLAISLLILFAALSASADGFLLSTNAIAPERRAALEALCERLEACNLPRLPRGSEWTDNFDNGRKPPYSEFYFGGFAASGHSWRLPKDEGDGIAVFVNPAGLRYKDASKDIHPARPSRDAAKIVSLLLEEADRNRKSALLGEAIDRGEDVDEETLKAFALGETPPKQVGAVVIFTAQLFRAGFEAEADAVLRVLEKTRGLESAERDARHLLHAED